MNLAGVSVTQLVPDLQHDESAPQERQILCREQTVERLHEFVKATGDQPQRNQSRDGPQYEKAATEEHSHLRRCSRQKQIRPSKRNLHKQRAIDLAAAFELRLLLVLLKQSTAVSHRQDDQSQLMQLHDVLVVEILIARREMALLDERLKVLAKGL